MAQGGNWTALLGVYTLLLKFHAARCERGKDFAFDAKQLGPAGTFGMSEHPLRRALQKLIELGLVEVVRCYDRRRGISARYTLAAFRPKAKLTKGHKHDMRTALSALQTAKGDADV